VDAIIENHVPLLELPLRGATAEDEVISRIIADMVPDGACLQMGVGALPNLVCAALKDRNDLGIHTEALNPGLVDLIRAGAVTNRRKAIDHGKTVFTFAMGQKAMYDFLHDNPAITSAPVDYVNDPRIIAQNDNVVSINATIQIDLTGACNSEHMLGHQYSASGGQLDFVRGSRSSPPNRPRRRARSRASWDGSTGRSLRRGSTLTTSSPSSAPLISRGSHRPSEPSRWWASRIRISAMN
jgi:itaconate CoA-transferase